MYILKEFFHDKMTTNIKLQFKFDKGIQKEVIGQDYYSNNFSVHLHDFAFITLQVKLLRKSYTMKTYTMKMAHKNLVSNRHSYIS